MKIRKKSKGMSLVELIAAMGIMVIISVGAMSILLDNNKIYKENDRQVLLQDEGRLVMDALEEDIRMSKFCTPSELTVDSSITIDGEVYNCSGVTNGDVYEVIANFSRQKGTDKYVYTFLKKDKKLIKAGGLSTDSNLIIYGNLSENVENITIDKDPAVSPNVEIKFKLKKGDTDIDFQSFVLPRNKQK